MSKFGFNFQLTKIFPSRCIAKKVMTIHKFVEQVYFCPMLKYHLFMDFASALPSFQLRGKAD